MTGLRYVYGIVPTPAAPAIAAARLAGIDGSAVDVIVEAPLAAVSSVVDEREYSSDVVNERIRDMDWLTPRAAVHQAVNASVLEIAETVLPLSFGVLYLDDDRVRAMLREDAASRTERLSALRGRGEWVVTVTRDGASADAPEDLEELDREIATSAPGRAFLLEKRRTRVAREVVERSDADAARLALVTLEESCERTYREPVATGGHDAVILRVSLLATREAARGVDEAIASLGRDLAARGYAVRSTGPWPAYRFGSLP